VSELVDVHVGETRHLVVVENLTRTRIVQYAGVSGDYNPLHTDEIYAREVAGFSSVVAHGMLTMGMTGRVLTEWFGAEQLIDFSVRFVAQVWPGDTLTAVARVESIGSANDWRQAELSIATRNHSGDLVLVGSAAARVA
jgi:acyl dehydratase